MTTPCANFASEIAVVGTDCVIANISGDGSCDNPYVIAISESISTDAGNAIECRDDGLFASPEILCYHLNFSIAGAVNLMANSNQIYEPITSGSSLTFKSLYLDTPSSSGSVVYAIKTAAGVTIATATFTQGSNVGSWSTSSYVMPSTLRISGEVVSAGVGASGLSAPVLVCEPDSAYADPGDFYNNIDPVQICAMIASNCNATLTVTGGNTLRFTGNDGSVTNINVETLIDVCQQVADNCNATLVNNGNGTITFTSNAGVSTTISLSTSSISTDSGNIATVGTDGNTYVPSRTAATAWPYSGAITTGQKIFLGADNRLYGTPKEHKFYAESSSTAALVAGTFGSGTTFRPSTVAFTNADPSGRTMSGWIAGYFYGVQTLFGTGIAQLQMGYQFYNGTTWVSVGQPSLTSQMTITTYQDLAPFTYMHYATLAPGQSLTFGVRYQVLAANNATYSSTGVGQTKISGQLFSVE